MRTHIDWITFTMAMVYPTVQGEDYNAGDLYADTIMAAFERELGRGFVSEAFGGEWTQQERSRAPYTDAWTQRKGVTLFASPNLTHCCVELSGTACEELIERGLMDTLLALVHHRVTRIDIACDIETSTRPPAFVAQVVGKRMQSSGYQKSSTGETCYVGSQKSDRYARVYRYEEPHPRSHLLRVEHVFRKSYAKATAKACLDHGLEGVAKACQKAFDWGSTEFTPSAADAAPISSVKHERGGGGTVAWLVKQAAPAFRRLVEDGTIPDPQAFLAAYFLTDTTSQ